MNVDPLEFIRLYGWYLGTFVYAVLSGAIPVLNCEVFLLVLAVKAPREMLFPLIVTTTVGQMVAKSLLYWAGRGVLRLPGGARVENVLASLGCKIGTGWRAAALVFASAVVGIPPFYAMSVACGAMRWSFASFLLFGCLGRLVRFSFVLLVPPGFGKSLPNMGPAGMILAVVVGVVLVLYALRKARTKPEAAPPVAVASAVPPAAE
jgi:membrane protein YqaA with SNARE-associated domain